MKRIEFRGKSIDAGEWVYGSLLQWKHWPSAIAVANPSDSNFLMTNAVYPHTVGQCTGRNDRNGKDVYEGDIALMDYSDFNTGKDGKIYAVVRWIDDLAAFVWDAGLNYYADMRNADNVEICGNIHDNPELLEDGK